MRSLKQPVVLAMLSLLMLLLLCNRVGNVHCGTVHENNIDMHALLDFKHGITSDPNGVLGNWSTDTHFCRWNGISCTKTRPFHVLSLVLSGTSLGGQITPSLGNLTSLQWLDLSSNKFVGPLPILSHLQHLQTLYLYDNHLEGVISDSLINCSSLVNLDLSINLLTGVIQQKWDLLPNLFYFNLSENLLVGSIPSKLCFLSNLAFLDLSENSLVGEIPPQVGFLSNLTHIDLRLNQLEGRIPGEIGQLPKLENLLLGQNKLSGEIPHAIFNLSSLELLSLEFNMLGKALPPNMGDLFPNLTQITLENNMFEGHIPASLGNATLLEIIDLSSNNFIGQIPTSFGKLLRLTLLNLELNHLGAMDDQDLEFLNSLTNCSSLKFLSLAHNQLQGFIPQSIGNLSTSLQTLRLVGNSLSGQVPHSIGKLGALTTLLLGENNFTGSIECWIRNLTNIGALHIQYNSFTGPIPSFIGNFSKLIDLALNKNKFEGVIPDSLGNLSELLYLDLSHNNLEGFIPPNFENLQQLVEIYLGHNNLQGYIPQISNLKQLSDLDLSSNKLTGEIPDSLGQCYGLVNVQIDQNFLVGNIPINFGNLSMLSLLNLSHNNLSGTIPLPLNEIKSLIELDISYNHLQGNIPRNGVFENATAVSIEGNWGLCGGTMDLHMPLCPTVSRRSVTKYYLVIALIPIFGFTSLVMLIYTIFGKKTSQRTYLLLLSFGKKFPVVSYKDLDRATRNFSESSLIGRGSYGSVYVGKLTQAKIQVAIKVFDLDMKCADKSFVTECDVLRSIRHRNLLPILTACSTIDNNGDAFKALVYEYMPNGNLDTWLHNKFFSDCSKCLSLVQRVSIAVGIADALAYLHHDCERLIVHCDLKPNNILLDDDMNVYLGDFGIASLLGHSSPNISTALKGTIGYIAPEYAQSGQISSRGDVYSFGVVLLEIMIGKRPTDSMFENDLNIVTFVERSYPDHILNIVDVHLHGEFKGYIQADNKTEDAAYECLLSLMQVALSCTNPIPKERMNMREVATKLHAIRTSYIGATRREQVML